MRRLAPLMVVPMAAASFAAFGARDGTGDAAYTVSVCVFTIYLLAWLYRRDLAQTPALGLYFCFCLVLTFPAGQRAHHEDVFQFLIGLAAAAGFLGMIYYSVLELRRQAQLRRAARGLCRACGYDLRASPGPACPECGTARTQEVSK